MKALLILLAISGVFPGDDDELAVESMLGAQLDYIGRVIPPEDENGFQAWRNRLFLNTFSPTDGTWLYVGDEDFTLLTLQVDDMWQSLWVCDPLEPSKRDYIAGDGVSGTWDTWDMGGEEIEHITAWGGSCGATPIPEPSTLGLLCILGVVFIVGAYLAMMGSE